jgi:hypothetical protein
MIESSMPDISDGRRTGGACIWGATAPVTFWGALAMALTAAIGKLFVTVVRDFRRRDLVRLSGQCPVSSIVELDQGGRAPAR